jgi:hypothetical protein
MGDETWVNDNTRKQNISDMEAPIVSPNKEFQGNANSKEGHNNVDMDVSNGWGINKI